VDAEDALIAALKIKAQRPEALIMYVRRQNKRGDTRHPRVDFPSSGDLACTRAVEAAAATTWSGIIESGSSYAVRRVCRMPKFR
jgi:hypothetical protein